MDLPEVVKNEQVALRLGVVAQRMPWVGAGCFI
jgi:hypothetical protein